MIVPYRDGPYLVHGPFVLRDQTGAEIDAGRQVIALCRCGKSRIRPFCDGSHHVTHFRAPSEREDRVLAGALASGGQTANEPADCSMAATHNRWAHARKGGTSRRSARAKTPADSDAGTPGPDITALHDDLLALRGRLLTLAGTAARIDPDARVADAARLMAAASAALLGADARTSRGERE